MAISYVGSATGTTTATMPAHEVGDLIYVYVYNSASTTVPTLLAGWTSVVSSSTPSTSYRIVRKFATTTSETVDTWDSTSLMVVVYRGVERQSFTDFANGTGTTVTYQTLSSLSALGKSWVVGFGLHNSNNTGIENPPTGMVNRTSVLDGTTGEIAIHDTNQSVSSWTSQNVSVGGSSSFWYTDVLELIPILTYTQPEFIGSTVSAGGSTITLPTHQAGDLILIHAFRDGNTAPPSLPSGWTNITSGGASTCSNRAGYKIAASSSETSGTWTSSTTLIAEVWRNVNPTSPIGVSASGGTTGTTITYPNLTLTKTDGSTAVSAFGGHRSANVAIETVPSDMTLTNSSSDATDEAASFRILGPSSFTSKTASVGGTSSGWRAHSIEILGAYTEIGTLSSNLGDVTIVANNSVGGTGDVSINLDNVSFTSASKISIRANASNSVSATLSSNSNILLKGNLSNTISNFSVSSSSNNLIKADSSRTLDGVNVQSVIALLVPKFADSNITIGSIATNSSSKLEIKGNINSSISSILNSSTALLPIKGQTSSTLGVVSSDSTSIISTKGIATTTLDGAMLGSTSRVLISSNFSNSLGDISSSSTAFITTQGFVNSVVSLDVSSTSKISISGQSSTIVSVSTSSGASVLLVAELSKNISDIVSRSTGFKNPYSYSQNVSENVFQTSSGTEDYPYEFSDFNYTDKPYRS